MTVRGSRSSRTSLRALLATYVLLSACVEPAPTDPAAEPDVRFAKGGSGGSGGGGGGGSSPTVKETNPSSGALSTTLTVRVIGSNYVAGSRAVWALNGDSTFATTKVKTNSTTYVSSKELRANITIEGDANLDLYDVIVITPAGKKGIGIELFEVTPEIIDLGAGDNTIAFGVNDSDQVVGGGFSGGIAFIWENGVLRPLGVLPGHTSSRASDINESGQVVGTSSGPAGSRAFIWTNASGMQALPGTLGGTRSEAWGINESGDVVGASTLSGDTASHAALWRNGAVIDLQAALGPGGGYAWDINDAGTVIGTFFGTGVNAGFRWTDIAGIELMWSGTQGNTGEALGLNAAGVIAGWKPAVQGAPLTAFTWSDGVFRDLGTLGGSNSVAMAINDVGAVVGRAETGSSRGGIPQRVAFIWTEAKGMRSLGLPLGRDFGQAWDINETGIVVGETSGPSGSSRATIWRFR
jgi:probable HAF family extracellular repeat protein